MVYHPSDLLAVALQNGDNLLCVLVKHHGILVIATGDDLGCVFKADVQSQDARGAGTVQALGETAQTRTDINQYPLIPIQA